MTISVSKLVTVEVAVATTPAPKRLKGVKFKTPPIESEELDRFYDIVFAPDSFYAGWAGRIGHYAYDRNEMAATNQDGYIYLWPITDLCGIAYNWKMSANPETARAFCSEYVEINI